MNSHQRRTSRRYWKYHLELGAAEWKHNALIITWCNEHYGRIGKGRWHYRYVSYFPPELDLWFHEEKDAAWFKLTWY